MFNRQKTERLFEEIFDIISSDSNELERLRQEVRILKMNVRPIRPYSSTAVSIVSADSGNNSINFDPFLLLPLRVVDSFGKTLYYDVVSPYFDISLLNKRHFKDEKSLTPLGKLMRDLGVKSIDSLSYIIPKPGTPKEDINLQWVNVYRDLIEWAALYDYIISHSFVSHTLIVRDGLLRSKFFKSNFFFNMWELIKRHVERIRKESGRKVLIAGLAKRSRILDKYSLAMFIERVMFQKGPCYVKVPKEIESKVYRLYKWREYPTNALEDSEEQSKFSAGQLYFVKFGPERFDPIWPVDIWIENIKEAEEIFGYLLNDAQLGFPMPYYPLSLQKAHEYAQMSGIEMEIIEEIFHKALRKFIGEEHGELLDTFYFAVVNRKRRFFE